jgi:hypothetical protein
MAKQVRNPANPGQNDRSLAIGMSYVGVGTYPGAGVPATTLTQITDISAGSVVFNFAEPNQINIMIEGTDEPRWSVSRKGDVSNIEFAIPSPSAEDMVMFCGGVNNEGTWEEPTAVPSINLTLKMITEPYQGKYTEYVITNAAIFARLSQAPTKEASELLLVRATKQIAMDATGNMKPAFTHTVKTAPTQEETSTVKTNTQEE